LLEKTMFKTIVAAAFAALLMTAAAHAAGAHHVAVGSTLPPSGHGLPPQEANSSILAQDVLGPKYCGLPFDKAAIHRAWITNAEALGVPLANLSAEINDRVRAWEHYWSKDAPALCNDAERYGRGMGYLPQGYSRIFR
jgi:hypothetical protein